MKNRIGSTRLSIQTYIGWQNSLKINAESRDADGSMHFSSRKNVNETESRLFLLAGRKHLKWNSDTLHHFVYLYKLTQDLWEEDV